MNIHAKLYYIPYMTLKYMLSLKFYRHHHHHHDHLFHVYSYIMLLTSEKSPVVLNHEIPLLESGEASFNTAWMSRNLDFKGAGLPGTSGPVFSHTSEGIWPRDLNLKGAAIHDGLTESNDLLKLIIAFLEELRLGFGGVLTMGQLVQSIYQFYSILVKRWVGIWYTH